MTPTRTRTKPCHICGALSKQGACPQHRTPPPTNTQRKRRTRAVVDWIAANGYVCPGWHRHYHSVAPGQLTADHTTPRSKLGGPGEDGPLSVLCRSCNSAKRNRAD